LKVSDPKVRDLNLAELQLAPSSILLLRFEDEALNGMLFLRSNMCINPVLGSDIPAPLVSSVLSQAIDLPAPPQHDVSAPSEHQTTSASASMVLKDGQKKIPKWLKMGLSKYGFIQPGQSVDTWLAEK
jgi:tether containing UBX domain for GLUT4